MASPQSERLAISPTSARPLSLTPGSRVLQTPLIDETFRRRLKEAGFDEESINRRDKAALVAYIAKLEAELFEHQHHMGLLILERKEVASKCEEMKSSAETAEIKLKCDQAAHSSTLAEARKQEQNLKKALGVEKECVASLEKALHEMRAEFAETKVATESKFTKARRMEENAEKKFTEANAKLLAAESLQEEVGRYHRAADRKLQEVEAREDDLRRRIISFKSDCDAKERETILERQTLSERQKNLQLEQQRILDAQALLNQREDYIFSRSQELDQLGRELEISKMNIENQLRDQSEQKSNLDMTLASHSKREEAIIKREALLDKKEQELHILKDLCASKKSEEFLNGIADHEAALKTRQSEFEVELEMIRKQVEDEIESKRKASELRELDIIQQEDLLCEREHDLEVQSRALGEKEKDVEEKLKYIDKREKSLGVAENELELKKILLQKERKQISKMKLDIQKSLDSLKGKEKEVDLVKEKLDALKTEMGELSVLEMKLKEEIDSIRAQKYEFMAEADRLQAEKAKFEVEWESIDEKREELRKEEKRIDEQKLAISKFIKNEHDSLRLERSTIQQNYKQQIESLRCHREKLMNEMAQEHSQWFNKMQQERADFLLDIEVQRRELMGCIEKREEEIKSRLREKEKSFEQEKKNELQYISSLRETAAKEMENVTLAMERLDCERTEINLDRERRNKEWEELNSSIEELKVQGDKLKRQRELLHVDREEILAQIDRLKELEDLKMASDTVAVAKMEQSNPRLSQRQRSTSTRKGLNQQTTKHHDNLDLHKSTGIIGNSNVVKSPVQNTHSASPSSSVRLSWIKRCAERVFKFSPENFKLKSERPMILDYTEKDAKFKFSGELDLSDGYEWKKNREDQKLYEVLAEKQLVREVIEKPKIILEVPAVSEDVRETNDLESEIGEDVCQAGRKRRAGYTSDDRAEISVEDRRNNKKRKHQDDAHANSSKQAIMHCVISAQTDVLEDQQTTFSQTQAVEETSVLVADNIIKISQLTTATYNYADQDVIHCLHNPDAESEQDILQREGRNGNANLKLSQEVDVSAISDQNLKNHGLSNTDGIEKINDNVGRRLRLKQKL